MLASLTTTPKKAKAKMEYSDIEDDLDDDFNDGTADDSFYNKDPVIPVHGSWYSNYSNDEFYPAISNSQVWC